MTISLKKITSALFITGLLTSAAFAQGGTADPNPVPGQRIRVNSVGFLPNMPKRASISMAGLEGLTAEQEGAFVIKNADDDEIVLEGTTGTRITNNDTPEPVRVATFTELTEPGRYYVEAHGDKSPVFEIKADAFKEAFRTMMLGMYLWRCGMPNDISATLNGVTYTLKSCHRNDAHVCHPSGTSQICVGGTSGTRDATGGWHDAGDYNKYTVNSGIATGLMLKAWENHSGALEKIDLMEVGKDGDIPAYLAEIKWNLDWVAKMQYGPNDGRVSHKLSAINFNGYEMPDEETAPRYFAQWSTAATGAFIGQLALASRLYEPYDAELAAKWLAQARVSYDVLFESGFVRETQAPFQTGGYGASDDRDQRMWAAVEMWETTGEERFLQDFESLAVVTGSGAQQTQHPNMWSHLGWGDVSVMAGVTYVTSQRTGKTASLETTLRNNLISAANGVVTNTTNHSYGRAFGTGSYYWGAHGGLTANTYLLNAAHKLTGEARYREAGHEILGHIFGRNYFGRSYVTGIGHNPPVNTHDRRSIASGKQWPGYLVGGPHSGNLTESNGSPIAPPGAVCNTTMPGACYFDDYRDYARNEIAINWNGSMIYALSGFLDEPEPTSIAPSRNASAKAKTPQTRVTRMVSFRNGRASTAIPQGAKIYSLDGRLVAQRKHGDQNVPVINRNGMFIMKVDNLK